ncbi:MAG: group II intron reverse transcriptase/maturase [Bacteroidales bacterium]|nr:group II intron reverse transcriptase/maturase [Bacteroidales bacterium]
MSTKLYSNICNINTLWRAWNRLNKKSEMRGIDGMTVKDFEKRIHYHLKHISQKLEKGQYVPKPATQIFIPKSTPGKMRELCIPVIEDKIVQESVRSVIEPFFSADFCDFSYAYRTGKGPQKAIGRVSHYLRQKQTWIAAIDIENFFGSIDHDILLKVLSQKIHEQPILDLITLWLKTGVISKGKWIDVEQGISQGNVISPLLSNIYLHAFDIEMRNNGFSPVRYADDIIFLEKSYSEAVHALKTSREFLEKKLHLKLNPTVTTIGDSRKGFIFLGYLFKGTALTIAPQKITKIQENIRRKIRNGDTLNALINNLNDSICGWRNYYSLCDTDNQMQFLNDYLFNELKSGLVQNRQKDTLSKKELTNTLHQLECFKSLKFSEMEDQIQFLIQAISKTQTVRINTRPKVNTIEKKVASQKKKYEKLLGEESDLVISKPGHFIGKTSRRVVVRSKGRNIYEVPFFRLKNILITSYGVSLSSDLINYCSKEGIPISFCDFRGRPYAQIFSASMPFYKLTLLQVNANTNEKSVFLARSFATGKIKNQINLIKYYNKYKDRKESEFVEKSEKTVECMASLLHKLKTNIDDSGIEKAKSQIMGYEGQAAASYWQLIKYLLSHDVYFKGRENKGATDIVNSLLNYGYGILYSMVHQAVILARLNPNIGFLHKEQPGKPTLVFDLVEEFRQPIVDKVVLSMIRKKEEITMEGISLSQDTRDKLVHRIMQRINTNISFRGKKMLMREIIKYQSQAVAKYLNGTGKYKPYIDRW